MIACLIMLLQKKNKIIIPNLFLNLSSILTNTGKNFGMQENCRLPLNILNGDDSMKL